jgi:ABC-type branched-subunit amino acid transport system ATPase component/branched-subunit amino acid ABC-type transport system permease component
MERFLVLTISGGVSGAVYSLLAVGLVLTYSTSGVFNFAHAAVAYTTAFLFFELNTGLGWPVWLAAIVSILVFAPALGFALDKLIFSHLARASQSARIVATVGMMIAIPQLALWVVDVAITTFDAHIPNGDNIFSPPGLGPVPKEVWHLTDSVRIDSNQLIVLIAAAVSAAGLWLVVQRTRVGLAMRAAVDRPDLAQARGVDTKRVSSVSWALGFGLAGLAGVVGAPLFSLAPATYTTILFVAATAAVLGGLRSLPLAFAGGLALGITQSWVAGYATFASSITGFSTAVPFLVLFLGLLVLNRDRGRVAGQVADADIPLEQGIDLPAWRRYAPWIVVGTAGALYFLFAADTYWQGLLVKGLAYAIIFLSFTLVVGAGGMVSLAQAGFVAIAAMTTGLLLSHGWPFVPAAAVGVAAAALAGAIVALPSIRLGGLALALATLALALIGERVLFSWNRFTNGSSGWRIPQPVIGPFDLRDARTTAITFAAVFAVLALLIRNLQRSRSWRAIVAVRTAPPAATSVGVSLTSSRLLVFALSAAVAGLGGVLLSAYNGGITSSSFPATVGLVWLSIVVLFGTRRTGAALVAGVVFAISPEVIGWFTDSTRIANILFGLGAVQLAKTPDGLLGGVRVGRRRRAPATDARPATEARPVADAAARVTAGGDRIAAEPPASGVALRSVTAGYGAVEVLHGIDLDVRAGQILAILGPNGSGKSTLCKAVAGLLPISGGGIVLDGADISRVPAHRRAARGIAYAPESRGIFPGLTVEENLSIALPRSADRATVYERLPRLGERRGLAAGNLSGGEQQMLALAPFVVQRPQVLVVDEPSLGLAPLIVEQVVGLLRELRDGGTAVLVVEEKASHLLEVADTIALFELGRITWSGAPSDLGEDQLADAYLARQS